MTRPYSSDTSPPSWYLTAQWLHMLATHPNKENIPPFPRRIYTMSKYSKYHPRPPRKAAVIASLSMDRTYTRSIASSRKPLLEMWYNISRVHHQSSSTYPSTRSRRSPNASHTRHSSRQPRNCRIRMVTSSVHTDDLVSESDASSISSDETYRRSRRLRHESHLDLAAVLPPSLERPRRSPRLHRTISSSSSSSSVSTLSMMR